MNVKLISYTQPTEEFAREWENNPDLLDLVSYCARVSNPSNQMNEQTAEKLVRFLAKHGHWSPFEMVNAVLEINTTRDIAHQIVRHRSFSFQEFCVSGDTEVTTITNSGRTKKVRIQDLYKRWLSPQYWGMSDNLVRVYDEANDCFETAPIKEVFETGIKPVYRMTLESGKTITATKDHKFFSHGKGFGTLDSIDVGDFAGVNVVPVYQSPSWLEATKNSCIKNGTGLYGIAASAGTTTHTIRKWLKKHGLQFSKKEVAEYTRAWNKGLPIEQQPRYGKPTSKETRNKMRESARKGEDSNLYKHGESYRWRKGVAAWAVGFKRELYNRQEGRCGISGQHVDFADCEVDHIKPVYKYPDLAFDPTNLQVVHKNAHREKSLVESVESRYTMKFDRVKSIEYVGEVMTYDLEVDHTSHNYIANGIVSHNSQRYADPTQELDFVLREPRLQDSKNRQNSIELGDTPVGRTMEEMWYQKQKKVKDAAIDAYTWAIEQGIAKEQARAVLPEGMTTSRLYMNGTLRSWIHYIQLRSGNGTQKEHSQIARECACVIASIFPMIDEYLGEQ